ncbi:MAG: hypothetical protein AAFV80_07465, partial [Bacteroidota bacterium]
LNTFRSNATLYIHGHSAGGTNPSLVEAMALGLPILAFDVIYNKITTEYEAFYFHTAEDIHQMLGNLKNLPVRSTGFKMSNIAARRYTWSFISNKYHQLAKGSVSEKVLVFDFELPGKLQAALAS